jgi:hypothetical protein
MISRKKLESTESLRKIETSGTHNQKKLPISFIALSTPGTAAVAVLDLSCPLQGSPNESWNF